MGRTVIKGKRAGKESTARRSRVGAADEAPLNGSHEMHLNKLMGRLLVVEKELTETRLVVSKLKIHFETELLKLYDIARAHRSQLEADRKTIINVVAKLNNSAASEPNSGTLRSALGRMSDEGAVPIDQRPVKGPR